MTVCTYVCVDSHHMSVLLHNYVRTCTYTHLYTVGPLYNGSLGPEKKTVCYTEVNSIRRLFCMRSNLSGPTKTVCYREVSFIQGIYYKTFHCTCIICDTYVFVCICMRMCAYYMYVCTVYVRTYVCICICILYIQWNLPNPAPL